MDTTKVDVVPGERQDEKKEPRGSGLLFQLRNKLGLGPPFPSCGGPAIRLAAGGAGAVGGVGSIGGAGFGLAAIGGGLLSTTPGIVAVILSCLTVVTGLAALGSWAYSPGAPSSGPSDAFWSNLPAKPRGGAASAPAASAEGASSSLDYMAQAARTDSWLQERIGGGAQPGEVVQASAGPIFSSPSAGPNNTTAAAHVSAGSVEGRLTLAKAAGFGNQSLSGSAGTLRDAVAGGKGATHIGRVYGLTTPMGRTKTAALPGRRPLIGSRGARTSDALRFANRDGLSQKGSRNPSMAQAGATFDGAGIGLQASPGGTPIGENFGGIGESPTHRFSPDKALDQKEVPQPAKPPEPKETTPYKWAMYAAIGALLAAMLLQKMAGSKKDAAKALVGPAKAAMLASAAMFHMLAAAAGGLAAAMGAIMMSAYGQKMQGLMFTVSGGLLAAFNLKAAMDMSKASKEAEKTKDMAMEDMKTKSDEINAQLGSGDGNSGGGDMSQAMGALGQGMNGQDQKPKKDDTTQPQPTSVSKHDQPVSTGTGDGKQMNF